MHVTQPRVELMLNAGVSFEEIERFIEERAYLSSDERSALWLLAWAETSCRERRKAGSRR